MAELAYKKMGDYQIPDLMMDGEDGMEEMPLGKYVRMRQTFLQERHKGRYTSMLLTGRLEAHQQAQEQIDRIVADLKKQNHVDEAMKARDQMGWVQAVNSFTAQAEEMVLNEIVYK